MSSPRLERAIGARGRRRSCGSSWSTRAARHAIWPRRRSEASTCSSGSCAQEIIRRSRRSTDSVSSTTPPQRGADRTPRRIAVAQTCSTTSRRSWPRRSRPRGRDGCDQIGVEHVLLGALHDPASGANATLRALGVTPRRGHRRSRPRTATTTIGDIEDIAPTTRTWPRNRDRPRRRAERPRCSIVLAPPGGQVR